MAALIAGCGNETSSPSDASAPVEPDAPVCASPGDSFSVGITKASTEGMTVAIEDANPAPPGIGKNEWKLRVKDGAGNPLAGATMNVLLYMPPPHDHSQPGSLGTDTGGGTYAVTNLNLTMPGLFRITVEVTPPDGRPDSVQFQFCVQRKGN